MQEYNVRVFKNKTEWYQNGKLHRVDGPAVERNDGSKEWWLNGERHRIDGPAIEHNDGDKEWWLNGQRHREDGPAIEYTDGYKAWWVDGRELNEKEFNQRTTKTELTVDEIEQLLGYSVKIIK